MEVFVKWCWGGAADAVPFAGSLNCTPPNQRETRWVSKKGILLSRHSQLWERTESDVTHSRYCRALRSVWGWSPSVVASTRINKPSSRAQVTPGDVL